MQGEHARLLGHRECSSPLLSGWELGRLPGWAFLLQEVLREAHANSSVSLPALPLLGTGVSWPSHPSASCTCDITPPCCEKPMQQIPNV